MVCSWRIPLEVRYSLNALEVYSPPLSVRMIFNFLPFDFSTSALQHKTVEDFILVFEHVHPCEMSAVINEGKNQGPCIDLSTQVTVDKIQWLHGSTALTGRECTLFVLSLNARLTEM